MDPVDLLIYSMIGVPALIGSAYGYRGWKAAALTALASLVGMPAAVLLWGLAPGSGCDDCVDLALYLPYVWLFVLMISGGAVLVAMVPAAVIGWMVGRFVRAADGEPSV